MKTVAILGVHVIEQGRRILAHLLRRLAIQTVARLADERKAKVSVRRQLQLKDDARHLFRQLAQQRIAVLQLLRQSFLLADVAVRAYHAQRFAFGVAADHHAAAAHPLPAAVLAQHAPIDHVDRRAPLQIVVQAGFHFRPVLRMRAPVEAACLLPQVFRAVAEHLEIRPGITHFVLRHIPVPHAVAAAFQGELPFLLFPVQLRRHLAQRAQRQSQQRVIAEGAKQNAQQRDPGRAVERSAIRLLDFDPSDDAPRVVDRARTAQGRRLGWRACAGDDGAACIDDFRRLVLERRRIALQQFLQPLHLEAPELRTGADQPGDDTGLEIGLNFRVIRGALIAEQEIA